MNLSDLVTHVNMIKLKWQIIWTGRNQVTSPTWGPPLPCKQALSQKFKLVLQSFYCCRFLFELINSDSK